MAGFVQSATKRAILLALWHGYARIRVWDRGPRVLINSIPKAGTHLLSSALEQNTPLFNSRRHVQMHKINQLAPSGQKTLDVELDANAFAKHVHRVRDGQFFSAHMFHDPAIEDVLAMNGIRTIFVVRDPRDILLSTLHYIKGLRRHHLHKLYTEVVTDLDDQIAVELEGRSEEPYQRPLKYRLQQYLGWTSSSSVLTVRFEDLIGARGGMSDKARDEAYARLSDHLGLAVVPRATSTNSPTFRKGMGFGWRGELTEAQARRINNACGEEINSLGYEI